MDLEKIIQKEESNNQQVLVDVPVIVEQKWGEKSNSKVKVPWRLILYATVGVLAVLVVIILIVALKEAPDLEVNLPTDESSDITFTAKLANPEVTPAEISTETEYRNENEGFLIIPPTGWQIDKTGRTGSIVVLLNPIAKVIGGVSYATLISVETHEVGEVLLADQVKTSKENTLSAFPDFIFENDSSFNLKGQQYYLIGGTYTVNGVKLRTRSLLTIDKGIGYAVTASGPLVTWPDNEEAISKSQFSFELLK